MNLLLLAIAFRVWTGSALSVYLRLMGAIALFSLEMQLATATHLATLRTLRLVNVLAAAISVLWHARRSGTAAHAVGEADPQPTPSQVAAVHLPPAAAIVVVGALISVLAAMRPVLGADPYHLHRVDQITGMGTLAYDPAALDVKINALAGIYELLLADLRVPGFSTALVRLHGLLGFALYLLSIAVVVSWLPLRRRWPLLAFLVIPVVFHQFVLVKNDLFGAIPAFVALSWVVIRGRDMTRREVVTAAALAGFAVGIKISSAPIALLTVGFVAFDHREWRAFTAALAGSVAGAVAGGLLWTLVQNTLMYGGPMQPYLSLGNRNESAGEAVTGVVRFGISLVDLGRLTPRIWPGRGGWGSTFGLPLIWAFVVLGLGWRERVVQRASLAAAACFLVFAANYPDADIAHRMVIGPGLLLMAIAIHSVERDDQVGVWSRRALVPVLVLSGLQIVRSATLYFGQG